MNQSREIGCEAPSRIPDYLDHISRRLIIGPILDNLMDVFTLDTRIWCCYIVIYVILGCLFEVLVETHEIRLSGDGSIGGVGFSTLSIHCDIDHYGECLRIVDSLCPSISDSIGRSLVCYGVSIDIYEINSWYDDDRLVDIVFRCRLYEYPDTSLLIR